MKFDSTGIESYQRDEKRELQGVWIPFPGGREFKIRRAGGSNEAFIRAFQQTMKPYRRQIDRGELDTKVGDQLMRGAFAKHVVIDWRGIKDDAGAEIAYTPELGVEFFNAFPELFSALVEMANDHALFTAEQAKEVAVDLGNA